VAAWCFYDASGRLLKDQPFYEAWTPPPEYASKTWGHKTMYLADVKIGSLGQTFRMLVDTGSWMVIVRGADDKLGCLRHPCFDSRNSTDKHQTAAVGFAHGSLSGSTFSDVVCAGRHSTHLQEIGLLQRRAAPHRRFRAPPLALLQNTKEKESPKAGESLCVNMPVLVAYHESEDFANAPFDGILGLGLRGNLDRGTDDSKNPFSFLEQLRAHGSIADTVFTLRLGNDGSSEILFGSADTRNLVGARFLWVPLSSAADGHWQLTLSDLTLNGIPQNLGAVEVVLDSGTSLLAPDKGLKDWLVSELTPSDCQSVDSLPWLGFSLPGGGRLTMLPSDYIDRVDGKCTLAVMPLNISASAMNDSGSRSRTPRLLLGDSFLRHFVTAFDMQRRRVGFGVDQSSDLAKDVAAALFPDVPSEILNDASLGEPGLSETATVSQDAMEDRQVVNKPDDTVHKIESPNDIDGNSAANVGMRVVAKSVADDAAMSVEEQAGYDFVRRLWNSKKQRHNRTEVASSNRTVFHGDAQAGNNSEDNLEEASKNLDRMLGDLKAQRTSGSNNSNISEVARSSN